MALTGLIHELIGKVIGKSPGAVVGEVVQDGIDKVLNQQGANFAGELVKLGDGHEAEIVDSVKALIEHVRPLYHEVPATLIDQARAEALAAAPKAAEVAAQLQADAVQAAADAGLISAPAPVVAATTVPDVVVLPEDGTANASSPAPVPADPSSIAGSSGATSEAAPVTGAGDTTPAPADASSSDPAAAPAPPVAVPAPDASAPTPAVPSVPAASAAPSGPSAADIERIKTEADALAADVDTAFGAS